MITSHMENLRSMFVEHATLRETRRRMLREDEEQMNEIMKLLVDSRRDKKLEEGSSRLNNLKSEVIEMPRDAHHNIEKETNKQLRELGESHNLDGVGEREGDGDMVGFEEDVKLLLDGINSYRDKQEGYVPGIRGIAGSGKTTLVRHLYSHADIVQNFDHRVWVSCKEISSYKELLINLLRQLPGGDALGAEEMECFHLEECVFERLQGKRFFLVFDDVRIIQIFKELLIDFHIHAVVALVTYRRLGSSIMWYEHDMKPLDVDKSWQLLRETMLLSNTILPKNVEKKGKAMLMKHTGGLPLAIKEVAMEWLEKQRLGIEWEDIVESEDLELRATLKVLDSSVYHHLDPDMKSCFQHLSFFKLGTTIRQQRFMDSWFASGVLGSTPDRYYICFPELKREKIIENSEYFPAKNFRISPIFHKLSIMKAKKGEDGAWHRVIYCSREKFNCSMDQNKQIKCLSFIGGGCLSAISPSYWKSFEQLRVLDFEDFGLKFLPETVGELIELRYLGLRNNYIQELPCWLGGLKKLEVLDIAHNFMVEMPDIIWEMDALVHLYISDIFCTKPLKIEVLKNLRTLSYISVDDWAYEVSGLQMMTSLRRLRMEGLDWKSDLSKLFLSLAVMEKLSWLVLRGFRFKSMPSLEGLGVLCHLRKLKLDGLITKLPYPEDIPPNLVHLTLVNSNFDDDPMPMLEKLRGLKYLKLQNAYNGRQMVISGAGFPCLNHLCIKELWHLRNIQVVGGGALKKLRELEITSCPYLEPLQKEMFNSCKFWAKTVIYSTKIWKRNSP